MNHRPFLAVLALILSACAPAFTARSVGYEAR